MTWGSQQVEISWASTAEGSPDDSDMRFLFNQGGNSPGNFRGGSVDRTPCFHCRRHGFNLWLGN